MKREYACSFEYGGEWHTFSVWADSWTQAEDMLDVIAVAGRVDGEIVYSETLDDDEEDPPLWAILGVAGNC